MFEVKNYRLRLVEPLVNSDFLDIAWVNDWPCVVKRSQYREGDLVTYIPADSIVPEELLESIGLKGKLSGSKKNRVKAVRLRGQFSCGLVLDPPHGTEEGQDVAEILGITKYEEPVPAELRGIGRYHPPYWLKYDIENIRTYNSWFEDGESVVITEKGHGCNCSFSLHMSPENQIVFSVSSRSITLEESDTNTYWKMARKYNIEDFMMKSFSHLLNPGDAIYLYCEILNTQDLKYGISNGEFEIRFFDLRFNYNWRSFYDLVGFLGNDYKTMPILYEGPFSKEKVIECTNGKEQVSGKELHIREGCVIRPVLERWHRNHRVIAKSISEDYLTRKDGTEMH
jgi:RNA ligase (TIGR02306 family)